MGKLGDAIYRILYPMGEHDFMTWGVFEFSIKFIG